MYKQVIPVINYKIIKLCSQPYYNHKKGCPNWNKKIGCPPNVMMFDKIFDLSKPIYIIYNKFDLYKHVNALKLKYPDWSEHKLYCCLYWQPKARKQLLNEIMKFREQFPNYSIERTPEAKGINLTATMKSIGISLEWPPKHIVYQIALAGIKIN